MNAVYYDMDIPDVSVECEHCEAQQFEDCADNCPGPSFLDDLHEFLAEFDDTARCEYEQMHSPAVLG